MFSARVYPSLRLISVGHLVFRMPPEGVRRFPYECRNPQQEWKVEMQWIGGDDCFELKGFRLQDRHITVIWHPMRIAMLSVDLAVTHQVRVFQKQWIRRQQARRLAFAMASHARLGAHASNSGLVPDLMRMCMQTV